MFAQIIKNKTYICKKKSMENYICPKCKGFLNVENELVFITVNQKEETSIIMLSSELGDYTIKSNNNINFKLGELVNFICPLCYADLNADEFDKNLAKVIKIDENGTETEIIFSKIYGEKCTYIIHEKNLDSYGENKDEYLDRFIVTLAFYRQEYRAEMLKTQLEEEGIYCTISKSSVFGEIEGVKVFVNGSDFERAREILNRTKDLF
jgi:uncharacterized protein YbaR (Trm112 family)